VPPSRSATAPVSIAEQSRGTVALEELDPDALEELDPEQFLARYVPHVVSADANFDPALRSAVAAAAGLPASATSAATSAMAFIDDLRVVGALFAAVRNDFDRLSIAPESTLPASPLATARSRFLLRVIRD